MKTRYTSVLFSAALAATVGCSDAGGSGPGTSNVGGSSGAAGTGGTVSTAGTGGGQAGTSAGGTANAGAGGQPGGGSGGDAGAGGAAGTGGAAGATAGGAGGQSGGAGGEGGSGGVGTAPGGKRSGPSIGCGTNPPAQDTSDDFSLHEVTVTGLNPVYLEGGAEYETSGDYDYEFRPYGVRLPANYDPNTPYPVTFGGGGCGGSAQGYADGPGGGYNIAGNGPTLQIGMSYMGGCFDDGGPAIDNRNDTPEEPYFRAIMAEIEQNYCIDLGRVFVTGWSSGAWQAYQMGCAAADLIRGIAAHEGGMRDVRPECKGPVAAVLVVGEADTENPIGPLVDGVDDGTINRLGSHGSAPGRDDILMRNNCVGTATTQYEDPEYPACVRYSGCPPEYPVVWCPLPGVGHNSSTYNGTNYSPGPMWDVLGSLPAAPTE